MANVALCLSVLALMLCVAITLALARLILLFKELRSGLQQLARQDGTSARPTHHVDYFKRADGVWSAALFTSESCGSCADRLDDLLLLNASNLERLVISTGSLPKKVDAAIITVVNRQLLGHAAVQSTPVLILYDSTGLERIRRVVASDGAMRDAIVAVNNVLADRAKVPA